MHCVLFGADVSRSRSPELHQRAAARLGIHLRYDVRSVGGEGVRAAFDTWRRTGGRGANVTAPHKAQAAAWCDRLTPLARTLGVVNSMTAGLGGVEGDNTDGPGLLEVLLRGPRPKRALVLGAGGVAPAALWALWRAGVRRRWISARRAEAADRLARACGAEQAAWGQWPSVDLVVSALPSEAGRDCFQAGAGRDCAWLDLSYGDPGKPTALVAAVQARGGAARDGFDMLREQAARSFARWTGRPLGVVREAMGAPPPF
ncbi:MAG TPA: hypothetical protein RMG48_02975 [Myxococcales bacterium LLY-WYZ-16_1]|nr:hypothetical protein [Myxococcales bacterium LLY-WYZ-16_1]